MNYLKRIWATVDTPALLHNFEEIKKLCGDVAVASVVKADAYGHYVDIVAPLLETAGTAFFAVSNLDEALKLRDIGITKPILILGYTPAEYAGVLSANNISQAVFSTQFAQSLSKAANDQGVTVKIHLKIDTGMGRIGFNSETETQNAVDALSLPGFFLEGIFTHFSVADSKETQNEQYTRLQYSRFKKAVDAVKNAGYKVPFCHCCNSAATVLFPEMRLDMCRVGIILYGLVPDSELSLPIDLKPVMSLYSVISEVKMISAGDSVSYGRLFTADKPTKIATVSAGYADGYPRSLSGTGEVLVHGHRAKIVGRICMDQFMIDVTDIDSVAPGDTVTLFGEGLPVEEIAKKAGTINYEIVCGISKRVPRVIKK